MSNTLSQRIRATLDGARVAPLARPLGAASVAALALALAAPPALAAGQGSEGDIRALRSQVELLMQRIQQLEAQQQAQARAAEARQGEQAQRIEELQGQQEKIAREREEAAIAPANVVTGGEEPGSFRLPGTNTEVKIGGYVKGDAIYNIDEDLGDSLAASAVVVSGPDDPSGNFRLHARQSRFNIGTKTPTKAGDLRTFIEGDFFTGDGNEVVSNSRHFRMRHAYGSLGPVLVGQTWSNFQNWHYGSTVDFGGPAGQIFVRQTQLRYSGKASDNASWAVALENPEGQIRTPAGKFTGKDVFPDVTGRFEWNNGDGGLSLTGAAALRFFDFGNVGVVTGEGTDTGFGVTVGGTQKFGNTSVSLSGTYGDGLGRYLYYGFLDGGAHLDANGNVTTTEVWGATASLSHKFSSMLSANLVYGYTGIDLPENLYPSQNDNLQTIHANLMFAPADRVTYGIEWQWASREQQNGLDGDAMRVQFGAKYAF